jgi:hypothetical protein
MTRRDLAIELIVFSRNYTLRLIDATPREDWFRQPAGGVTHVAWQVGHLAMAQYRLGMERIRGRRSDDADLISDEFLQQFGKGSRPDADAAAFSSAEAIKTVFDRVHQRLLQELPSLPDSELDQPVLKPHPLVKTKWWALLWLAQHEAVHAGQIGLVRRLLGYEPLW